MLSDVLVPMTVVETPGFLRDAVAVGLTEQGSGRHHGWNRRRARDLSLSQRISTGVSVHLFAKNEKPNLTRAESNEMKKLLSRLIAGYRNRTI
jgi:hypothetical protein